MVLISNEAITEKEIWDSLKQTDGSKAEEPARIYPVILRPPAENLLKVFAQLFDALLEEEQLQVHEGGHGDNGSS